MGLKGTANNDKIKCILPQTCKSQKHVVPLKSTYLKFEAKLRTIKQNQL